MNMIDQIPYHICMQYMHRFVKIQTEDGNVYEGIVAKVDNDNIILAIPDGHEEPQERAFGPYGFGGGFPRPRFRYRPFIFPLRRLVGIYPFLFFI